MRESSSYMKFKRASQIGRQWSLYVTILDIQMPKRDNLSYVTLNWVTSYVQYFSNSIVAVVFCFAAQHAMERLLVALIAEKIVTI